ncbi:MAG: hypothetical protein KBD00_04995 [Candidatus Peribacteraceae bacterium]|nr:hypothetical protein [Candidatus Peribacteraceae bacterium]
MSETGSESFVPGEGQGSAAEALSEQAKERFAAAARQMKQAAKDERRSRKRDDRVAKTIIQFLGDDQHTHMFILISRLVARDCPSIFILAILSLIHDTSMETVNEYIQDQNVQITTPMDASTALMQSGHLPAPMNDALISWITRLQLIMSIDGDKILQRLLVDANNIDGTVLQLTTFVLVEFFEQSKRPVAFEQLQPLTVSVLQTLIEPYMAHIEKMLLAEGKNKQREED